MDNYKSPLGENALKITQAKWKLFNYAFGDILRAINGRSLMGSFILSFCFIDYLAYIVSINPRDQRVTYTDFVRQPYFSGGYDPEKLYAIRCALVHTYGESLNTKAIDLKYTFTHEEPKNNNKIINGSYVLNLSNFVFDILKSSYNFFEKLLREKNESELEEFSSRSSEIINVYDHKKNITYKKSFGEINTILSPLDRLDCGKIDPDIAWNLVFEGINNLCLNNVNVETSLVNLNFMPDEPYLQPDNRISPDIMTIGITASGNNPGPLPEVVITNNNDNKDNFNLLLQKQNWKKQLKKPYKKK
ncbi:MAG: hypothetical protein ACYDIA_02340 [Candidatus Humimicrobiaceae bacterium]